MSKAIAALFAAGLMLSAAGAAHAQGAITVIGGGLAEACSKAAIAGESGRSYDELCTRALETENLNARDRAGTYVNRGVLRLRRKEFRDAEQDFDKAIKAKPDIGEAYANRGAAYIGQGRFGEALAEVNRALALGVAEPAKVYYNRALAYEGLEDAKSAYLDYMKAQELEPEWGAPKEQLTRFTVRRPGDAPSEEP